MDPILVLTATATEADAHRLATSIVESRLAACVQIEAIRSIYRWQGTVHHEPEHRLVIKTNSAFYPALEAHILANHPYTTPEIVALPITLGSPAYLAWITGSTT